MSLDYQFVTPLTSMTIRGITDKDGLQPVIDKPEEGRGTTDGGGEVERFVSSSWILTLLPFSTLQMTCPPVSFCFIILILTFKKN